MTEHHRSCENVQLPQEPIHRLLKPLNRFLHVEAASGVVLLVCSLAALTAANSAFSKEFLSFWKMPIGITVGGASNLSIR